MYKATIHIPSKKDNPPKNLLKNGADEEKFQSPNNTDDLQQPSPNSLQKWKYMEINL